MELLVIRHGQSEADILNVIEGRADFNLTELGNRQAELMAEWVVNYINVDKIISSSLKRAKQTAEKLALATNAQVEFNDYLMEWKNGLIAGLSRKEADEKYPVPAQRFPHTSLYEQESDIEFRARAETALSTILNENQPDAKIAVISHGGMINKLFQSFLCLPVNVNVGINSGDTGIHHWRVSENNRTVVFANSLRHLESLK
jgi:2,3-bisphosphoglycerate-dependent phosphoglycerate mutase